jgi:hypothetical protein
MTSLMSGDVSQVLATARGILERAGYIVLKAKSYRAAQERQRIAECLKRAAEEDAAGCRVWAVDCRKEERRLADRLTFVYGVAMAHGATVEELSGHQ